MRFSRRPPFFFVIRGNHSLAVFHIVPVWCRMETEQKQVNRRGGVWSRLRVAFTARRTPDPSIAQVMAQWVEYELIFNDILQRLNAQLARQAKYEKAALARLTTETAPEPTQLPPPVLNSKQQLRSHMAQQRFGGRVQAILAAKENRDVNSGESSEGP